MRTEKRHLEDTADGADGADVGQFGRVEFLLGKFRLAGDSSAAKIRARKTPRPQPTRRLFLKKVFLGRRKSLAPTAIPSVAHLRRRTSTAPGIGGGRIKCWRWKRRRRRKWRRGWRRSGGSDRRRFSALFGITGYLLPLLSGLSFWLVEMGTTGSYHIAGG